MTIKELSERTCLSRATTQRLVSNLSKKGVIEQIGDGRTRYFVQKKND